MPDTQVLEKWNSYALEEKHLLIKNHLIEVWLSPCYKDLEHGYEAVALQEKNVLQKLTAKKNIKLN